MKKQLVLALLVFMLFPKTALAAEEPVLTAGIATALDDFYERGGTLPRVYDISLSPELQLYTYQMCVKYDIVDSYTLILAQMWLESNFVVDVVSATDDYGLMQINKINHAYLQEELGITDFLDPQQNIEAGVYMMSKLLHKYNDNNVALLSYNMGEAGAKQMISNGIYTNKYIILLSYYLNILVS